MKIISTCAASLAVASLTLAYSGSNFSEKFEAMPKATQETAMANMEGALPIGISSVQGEQGVEYQVNTRLNGEYHNLVINDKGKLLAVKDETDLASVPAVVKAAVQKEASSSKVVTVEKVTEGGLVSYGAVIQDEAPGKFVRVRLSADGTVKSKNLQNNDR